MTAADETRRRRQGFLSRWRVAFASGIVLAAVFGVVEGFSIFYSSFVVDLGLDRAQASGMFAGYLLASMVAGPFAGRVVGHYGARRIILIFLPLFAAAVAAASLPTELWQFYLLYMVVLAPATTMLVVASQVIITSGYAEDRGRATGIAYACLGVGNFLLFSLLALVVQEYGWRAGYLVAGCLAALGTVGFLFMDQPGAAGAVIEETPTPMERATNLFRSPVFWLVCLAALTASVTDFFTFQTIVPFLTTEGHGVAISGLLLGMTGLSYAGGQLLGGVLSDRTNRELTATVGAIAFLAGLGLLWILPPTPLLVLAILLLGSGVGMIIGARIAAVGDLFTGSRLARAIGFFQVASAIGSAFATWFGGFSYSATGSYGLSFVVAGGCALLWIVIIWLAAPRRAAVPQADATGTPEAVPIGGT
ncbi:MFS transporter [Micromonospora inyonensis]|uniref:Sugar phosphate permease n=1 Tax=Micromonospora inyonensis TaxID=47866 RepID=A0A1C6RLP9_9ACTN|nr:MFS transporter [Micromonospora inyonensis]SCL18081.1 Sugar phosphate permease [Micromonospora inyonensis]